MAKRAVRQARRDTGRICAGTAAGGRPCQRFANKGERFCWRHLPRDAGPDASSDTEMVLGEITERLRMLSHTLGLDPIVGALQPDRAVSYLKGFLARAVPATREHVLEGFRKLVTSEYLDPDMWRGLWTVLQSSLEARREASQRRARGDYEVDDYGFDEELFVELRPLSQFFYRHWWRVEVTGIENVPAEGRCLLVANHSGVLPFDAAMISEAMFSEPPAPRYTRWLTLRWFSVLPFISTLFTRAGCVLACPENGERLLNDDHLVGVFPEGIKGIGKPFCDRYRLARFGRGGFVRMAMRTRAPIVPTAVVGAEEIYPAIGFADWLSRPLGIPYLPITPTWPWLGILGMIPLPTKWSIQFGEPLRFNESASGRANDYLIVSLLAERVREKVQAQIDSLLARRDSVVLG